MKTEVSAGGVVVRKKNSLWEVLLITDMNGELTFPKGIIEPGELPKDAAKREIREEVGISQLLLIKELTPISYVYQRNGLVQKKVHYLLFTSNGAERLIPQKSEGITKAQWVTMDQANELVGYPKTNRGVLREVQAALHKRS